MLKLKTRLKKWIALSIAAFGLGLVSILPAKAEGFATDMLLGFIVDYTHATAENTYQLERYAYATFTFVNSWMMSDDSETTKNLQAKFTTLTNSVIDNVSAQQALQTQLMQEFLQGVTLPEVNDLSYGSMLGQLFLSPDPRGDNANPAQGYIKNAAGLNITHRMPNDNWDGDDKDKENYKHFYSTITAVQSYSAYILSQAYTNMNLTSQQNELMQQASNSGWFAQVASENIGIVLRQILMYNSQVYVLLTQLLQTQREALAAQAMANTLIVLGNQFNEQQLLSKAQNRQKQ